MAKKKSTNNKKQKVALNFSTLKNEKFQLVFGIILILLGFYFLFVMISYLFTWKSDNIEWIALFSGADVQVENWGGKLGAYLSHTFMNKWFGLPSLGLTFMLVTWGASLIGRTIANVRKTILLGSVIIILSSLILGFFDNIFTQLDFLLGGQHGYFIINWLNSFLGQVGTIILLVILVFSFVIIISKTAFEKVKSLIQPKVIEEPNIEENTEEILNEKAVKNQSEETVLDLDLTTEEETNPIDKVLDKDNGIVFEVNQETEEAEPEETIDIIENNPQAEVIEELTIEPIHSESIDVEALGMQVEELEEEEEADDTRTPLEILGEYDPKADLSHFKFPGIEFLADHELNNEKVTQEELNENKDKIVETLKNYKIEITSISATIGPSITLYEIVPAPGVRISKIKNLEDDIALSLAALGIRIIAPMPGKGTVGIEVPNKNPQVVSMRSTISAKVFQESKYELPIILGKTIYNKTHVIDLAKTPHMLVAGATGQGKSVGINAILTSLLYKKHPAELKFVLIDPKKVELSIYSRIEKHYLAKLPEEEEPIITDVQKVVATLNSLAKEMDARYDLLKNGHVRNIIEYNKKFINRRLNPDKGHRYLPYIVVVIDEFADLIMTAGKEVEHPIARIAQLARAIGIHLIVATQRPSTNVITGMIKANFPTRVAFRVMQMVDSRTILDSPGANQLIGRGDMLVNQGGGEMVRLQCPFVDTPEIEELVLHIEDQQSYTTALLLPEPDAEALGQAPEVDLKQRDAMFEDAARLMVQTQQGSTSSIQRKFSIGYNRAGRIIDQLEAAGIVGPYEGSKARKVLYPDEYALEQFLKTL